MNSEHFYNKFLAEVAIFYIEPQINTDEHKIYIGVYWCLSVVHFMIPSDFCSNSGFQVDELHTDYLKAKYKACFPSEF